jgi:hypothetical protein
LWFCTSLQKICCKNADKQKKQKQRGGKVPLHKAADFILPSADGDRRVSAVLPTVK